LFESQETILTIRQIRRFQANLQGVLRSIDRHHRR
jgi:hypothetical protein